MENEDTYHPQPEWIEQTIIAIRFFLGITVDKKYRIYQKCHLISYVMSCLINIVGCIVAFLNNSSHKAKFVVVILMMFHLLTLRYFYIITRIKQDKIISLTEHYNPRDPKYLGRKAVIQNVKLMKKDLILFTTFYFTTMVIFFVLYLLLFKDIEESNIDVDDFHHYFMPLWFSCGDRRDTSSLSRLCWKVRNNRELLFCNMIQIVFLMYEGVYYFFSLLAVISLSKGTEAKAITLGRKIKKIENKTAAIITPNSDSNQTAIYRRQCVLKYDAEVCHEFKKVFKEQQRIYRFIGDIMSILQEEIFLSVVCAFLLVMLGTAGILAERNAGFYFRMRSAALALLIIYNHYILCETVHHIYEVDKIISEAYFDFCWYQQSIKFKKLLIISQILNQHTTRVKVHNSYVVNLSYFADNMKRLYAVLGIIRLKSTN